MTSRRKEKNFHLTFVVTIDKTFSISVEILHRHKVMMNTKTF